MKEHLKQFFQCPDCKEIQVANQAYQNIVQQDYVRGADVKFQLKWRFCLLLPIPLIFMNDWCVSCQLSYGPMETTSLGVKICKVRCSKTDPTGPLKNTWGRKELGPKSWTSSVWIHAYWMQLDQSRCRMVWDDQPLVVLLQVNKSDRPFRGPKTHKRWVFLWHTMISSLEWKCLTIMFLDLIHSIHTHTHNFVDPHWLNTASETEHT